MNSTFLGFICRQAIKLNHDKNPWLLMMSNSEIAVQATKSSSADQASTEAME
jgi:hypothetical protein